MRSRAVTDAVIDRFSLGQRYGDDYIEATRRDLWRHCSTKIDKKPGVVTVTCEDKDPRTAQAMTAYFAVVGNKILRHVSASSAGEERRFLEERVAEAKRDANEASARLREFEEKHKIIDLPEQSKAVVSEIASIKGDLLSKQLELEYLHGFSSSDESTAVQLRRQVGVMQSKMRTLEDMPDQDADPVGESPPKKRSAASNQGQDIFPVAMTVPKLRFELGELYREQKIQETLFMLLTQRYEMARVDEARDTSVFQVLDEPVVPTHHSAPKRAQLVIIGLLLGLIGGAAYALRDTLATSLATRS
jgi:capsule polysaccharide export protein KpsE/RkpR